MEMEALIDICREALAISATLMAPLLLVALLVGLLMGMFQTLTNIHDPTLSLVPRILAVLVAMIIGLPWLMSGILEYAAAMFGSSSFIPGG